MNVSIVDLATSEIVANKSITVENLILSRYPLLESLTTEYETRLNGSNALMTETTAIAMGYTWVRGYLQYSKPGGPKNIVDNEHLSLTVNGGLLLDQVNKQYLDAAENIDKQIDANFSDSADDVREANNNGANLLKDVINFPIGLTMRAEHVRVDGSHYEVDDIAYWDENVTLGVDMEPDYLDPMEMYPRESFYTLKLRNINLLRLTGAYVLLSMNPWICTVNSWDLYRPYVCCPFFLA